MCLTYGYSLNEYYDELKEKLVGDARTVTGLSYFIYFLLALALVLSWAISTTTLMTVALIGVTVWLHSSPPFRLKRHLIWRLFLNSCGFGLFFLTGASLDNQLSTGEILMGVFIFGLYLPLELIHVLAHMEADKAKKLPTVAHIFGEQKTIVLAVIFLASLIFYSALLWQLQFVSLAFAGWSGFQLLLLLLILAAFYKRDNNAETYQKIRFRSKIVCAIFGMGMLAILIAKI
jgi:4-hydroxybenzoate polyprenyltransferase